MKSFLGRIEDPPQKKDNSPTNIDSAFREIMFTDLKDSTLMTTLYGDKKALHLLHIHNSIIRNSTRKYNGNEVKHTGDGFMISFTNVDEQIACALEIENSFKEYNESNPQEELFVRVGLSAGEPIEEHGDFFGTAVQLAARLCAHSKDGHISASQTVFDHTKAYKSELKLEGNVSLKGFTKPVSVYNVRVRP